MKLSQDNVMAHILAFTLIFLGVIAAELPLAQGQAGQISQEDQVNPRQKKKSGIGRERNPFLLPRGVYLLSKGGVSSTRKEASPKPDIPSVEIEPYPFKVRAILISDHIRLASIGRYIVTVGDTIHDEKILEIKTDQVILGKGGNKRTLFLQQSPVKLTIEEK